MALFLEYSDKVRNKKYPITKPVRQHASALYNALEKLVPKNNLKGLKDLATPKKYNVKGYREVAMLLVTHLYRNSLTNALTSQQAKRRYHQLNLQTQHQMLSNPQRLQQRRLKVETVLSAIMKAKRVRRYIFQRNPLRDCVNIIHS